MKKSIFFLFLLLCSVGWSQAKHVLPEDSMLHCRSCIVPFPVTISNNEMPIERYEALFIEKEGINQYHDAEKSFTIQYDAATRAGSIFGETTDGETFDGYFILSGLYPADSLESVYKVFRYPDALSRDSIQQVIGDPAYEKINGYYAELLLDRDLHYRKINPEKSDSIEATGFSQWKKGIPHGRYEHTYQGRPFCVGTCSEGKQIGLWENVMLTFPFEPARRRMISEYDDKGNILCVQHVNLDNGLQVNETIHAYTLDSVTGKPVSDRFLRRLFYPDGQLKEEGTMVERSVSGFNPAVLVNGKATVYYGIVHQWNSDGSYYFPVTYGIGGNPIRYPGDFFDWRKSVLWVCGSVFLPGWK